MRSGFVRTVFLLTLIALITTSVFAETPKMLPYMTSKLADGVAGTGADGTTATGQLWTSPYSIAVDANNNIYFGGSVPATNVQVFKIDYATGVVSVFAGGLVKATSPASTCATPDTNTAVIPAPWTGDNVGDGCPAAQTNFNGIRGLAVSNGYLYISDSSASSIKKIYLDPVNPAPGRVYVNEMEPVVGGLGSTWNGDGLRSVATIKSPYGIAVDPINGNVYWGDGGSSGYAVRMYDVASDSVVTLTTPGTPTVAPTAGCQGATATPALTLATASLAKVTNPYGLAFDADGNLFVGDKGCYSVRKLTRTIATNKVDQNSPFSTLIGTGKTGTGSGSWYNTAGTPAYMGAIRSVASAGGDNMYITDTKTVWYYDATTGWVHQFMGNNLVQCTGGTDPLFIGCPASNVQFNGSSGGAQIATDSFGNIVYVDFGNNIIGKLSSGLDFVGTPNATTTAPAVANSSIMVHGAGVTGLAGSGPFSTGTAVCSTYSAGDLEAECVVPATYTPSANGLQTGTFTSTGNTAATFATQGFGAGISSTAELTITAGSTSWTYGGSVVLPTPLYTTDKDPIIPPLATAPTCTTAANSSSPVGTYPITCTGAVDPRFDPINYVDGTVTVNKAPVVVTADNKSIVLGSTLPTFTFTTSPVVTLGTAPICESPTANVNVVGAYPITCSGGADPHYTISYVAGTLSVSRAPVIVTADNKSMIFGSTVPPFTFTTSPVVTLATAADLLDVRNLKQPGWNLSDHLLRRG